MKQIESMLGFLLAQICRAHRQRAEEALCGLGLHVGQEMILLQLWQEEGLAQSQIAERMAVEPPTVTKMLHRMERAGLVRRQQCPGDARVSRVYLTEQGRALEGAVLAVWEQLDAQVGAGLSDTEQALLRRLLAQVRQNLG